jgi:hypothetical protein
MLYAGGVGVVGCDGPGAAGVDTDEPHALVASMATIASTLAHRHTQAFTAVRVPAPRRDPFAVVFMRLDS